MTVNFSLDDGSMELEDQYMELEHPQGMGNDHLYFNQVGKVEAYFIYHCSLGMGWRPKQRIFAISGSLAQ